MATGTTTVDFGSGAHDTSVAVASPTIAGGSLVEAWVWPVDTADHPAEDHRIDPPHVVAGDVVAGVGFTIYAYSKDRFPLRGEFTVAWAWA